MTRYYQDERVQATRVAARLVEAVGVAIAVAVAGADADRIVIADEGEHEVMGAVVPLGSEHVLAAVVVD
jgi:hypothetical protein